MKIDQQLLSEIAGKATESSSRALSLLLGQEVEVKTTQASYLAIDKLVDLVHGQEGSQIVAFSQLISGVKGAAFLVMNNEEALRLVDALMKKPTGTTKVLEDLDKSAIRETLNILSNSQLTALAKDLGITVSVMPPSLITRERIADVLDYLAAQQGDDAELIVFETSLVVTGQESQVTMFIIFDGNLSGVINDKENNQ